VRYFDLFDPDYVMPWLRPYFALSKHCWSKERVLDSVVIQ